jgi:uncharacterized membrane protein AbrB (regulator of aidB expression)
MNLNKWDKRGYYWVVAFVLVVLASIIPNMLGITLPLIFGPILLVCAVVTMVMWLYCRYKSGFLPAYIQAVKQQLRGE